MKYSLFFLFAVMQYIGRAQEKTGGVPIPVEILAGNNRLSFQMLVNKKISSGSRFGFFSLVSFSADYKNKKANNEAMVPVQLNYELVKHVSVNVGIAMNSNWGFRPSAGLQYAYVSKKLVAVLAPSFYLTETNPLETFGLLLYKPALNKKWDIYSRLQVLYSFTPQSGHHDRSYSYIRIGVTRRQISFGAGANWDRYGPAKIFKENYGLFVSADIF